MSKSPARVPVLRIHKPTRQAYVFLERRRHYLGKHGEEETTAAYHRLVGEWMAAGQRLPSDPCQIKIASMLERFWEHAKGYYKTHDGRMASSLANFRVAIKSLREHYGFTKAADFGPRALKAVRQKFVDQGHCRKQVNKQVQRIRQIFRWAVSEELIPANAIHALDAVPGLKKGRTEAPESTPVAPVPLKDINAIKQHVSQQVWAMVQVQLYTGARPGEVVIMRRKDIDTSGPIWLYRPITHKTAYRDKERVVFIGPRAQEALSTFILNRAPDAFIFCPQDVDAERRATLHVKRKTPMSCGNRPGTNRSSNPRRKPGACYTTNTYRRAVERGCDAAGIDRWTPGRLRHNAATNARKEFGLEAAGLLLGHAKLDVTQLYAEISEAKAREIASKIG